MRAPERIMILMADDDPDDYFLTKAALQENGMPCELRWVGDGDKLMDYLLRRGEFANSAPRPDLILLDLNMPKKNGKQALREIKGEPGFRQIPIVIYTTSKADEDIEYCYRAGADSYIQKPRTRDELLLSIRELLHQWFRLGDLPQERGLECS